MKRWLSGIISLLIILMSLHPTRAQAETVITQCDYQHVNKTIAAGGNITLDCDRVIQIWSNRPLTIAVDIRIKPAEGRKVTVEALKGRTFVVNAGISLTLENLSVRGNPNAVGGGIENNGGTILISNVIFSDNDDNAILNHKGGNVTISDSLFSGNQSYAGGGAIHNDAKAEMTISNTSFINNHSYDNSNGGAIYNVGKMSISGSTLSENIAHGRFGWGGAILNSGDGVLTIENSTFAYNSADHSGGAIMNNDHGQTTIQFSTLVENNASVFGGALYVDGGKATVNDSLFANNSADKDRSDCLVTLALGTLTTSNNLAGAGCGGTAATGIATLSNNGGLTQTVAIASDSNAIDVASECPTNAIDQRGTARPQGKGCDIGAYEFVEITTAATAVSICQVTTTRDVRLRQEPNTAGGILAVVTHGLTFQAIEQVTGWYHITYGTMNGWISADFVMTKGACGG